MIEQPLFETEINLMITPLGLSSPYRLRASSGYRWSEATVSGPWQLIVQSAVWQPETGGPLCLFSLFLPQQLFPQVWM